MQIRNDLRNDWSGLCEGTLPPGVMLLLARTRVVDRVSTIAADRTSTFTREKLLQMDAAILACIRTNGMPGSVLWIERHGAVHKKNGKTILPLGGEGQGEGERFFRCSQRPLETSRHDSLHRSLPPRSIRVEDSNP